MRLKTILFENPYYLIPVLFAVEFAFVAAWNLRRSQLTGRLAVSGLILFPLMVVVQWFVVTDAERVRAVCDRVVRAVVDGDVRGVSEHLADDFRFEGRGESWDKAAVTARIEQALQRWDVSHCKLSQFDVVVDDRGVRSMFQVTCRMSSSQTTIPTVPTRWELRWRVTEDVCEIMEIDPVRTQWMPYDRLDDLLGR